MVQRVLHIVSTMNRGGAETLLMNIHRQLDTSKVQFDYICHVQDRCDYEDEIAALGGRVIRVASLGQSGPAAYIRNLQQIMVSAPYMAVHSHTDYQGGFTLLAARFAGIRRRVCHSHSSGWDKGRGFRSGLLLMALRALIRCAATEYCACSSEAARFLFGPGLVSQGKVRLLKNGIDVKPFIAAAADGSAAAVKRELGLPQQSKVIGHVGRFSASKNHRFLLRVLSRLVARDPSFYAVFVGDGPLKREIEDEADRRGLRSHIRFPGVRTDIPRLLGAFDVFVFPSRFEGFGIVALEAQCSGVPCVVSDSVPAAADMGLGLVTFLSLEEAPDTWSEAVLRSLSAPRPDPDTRVGSISRQGFDISRNTQDWLALYGIT